MNLERQTPTVLFISIGLLAAIHCARYTPAPGYESLAHTPAPPECSARAATLEPDSGGATGGDSTLIRIVDERGRSIPHASVLAQHDSLSWKLQADDQGTIIVPSAVVRDGSVTIRAMGHNDLREGRIALANGVARLKATLPVLIFDGPCSAVVWQRKSWWHFW